MNTTPKPASKPHTRLAAIPPTTAVRGVSRGDIPGRRPAKPITFDSAL